jgi:hypothetical protein
MKNYVVYLTTYSGDKLPKYYIGSTSRINIESGKYFGSVRSRKYKAIFESEKINNILLFSVEVLSYHESRKDALAEELRLQKLHSVVLSTEYFNEAYATVNGYFGRSAKGKDSSKYGKSNYSIWEKKYGLDGANIRDIKYRQKQSILNSGENNAMFNRTNEVIAINDIGKKVRVSKEEFENNNKLSGHTIGFTYVIDNVTNEYVKLTRKEYSLCDNKYRHPNKGIIHTDETRKLLSEQRKDTTTVKNWDGKRYRVNKNDERIKTGELANNSAVRWLITDKNKIEHKVMDIEKFFLDYGILFRSNIKFIDGEIITNHKPRKGKSLVGWLIKRLDEKKTYKNRTNEI